MIMSEVVLLPTLVRSMDQASSKRAILVEASEDAIG